MQNPKSETLLQVGSVILQRPPLPTFRRAWIRKARLAANDLLLHLEGIDDRDQADSLRRCLLFVPREEMPVLPLGEFYYFEIEGYRVETTQGVERGHLLRVMEAPAQDLLVILFQGREILVPYIPELVPALDHERKTIVVVDLPGLFDDPLASAATSNPEPR